MKLHFEDNLDYQKTAIEAVADLFRGQDINRTEFTVSKLVNSSGQAKAGRPSIRHLHPRAPDCRLNAESEKKDDGEQVNG